jgi:hypothetical protein
MPISEHWEWNEDGEVLPPGGTWRAATPLETQLREALVQMDEAVCHGAPETAKRIAREAFDAR